MPSFHDITQPYLQENTIKRTSKRKQPLLKKKRQTGRRWTLQHKHCLLLLLHKSNTGRISHLRYINPWSSTLFIFIFKLFLVSSWFFKLFLVSFSNFLQIFTNNLILFWNLIYFSLFEGPENDMSCDLAPRFVTYPSLSFSCVFFLLWSLSKSRDISPLRSMWVFLCTPEVTMSLFKCS